MKMAEQISSFTGSQAFQKALHVARQIQGVDPDVDVVLVHFKGVWSIALVHPGQEAQ